VEAADQDKEVAELAAVGAGAQTPAAQTSAAQRGRRVARAVTPVARGVKNRATAEQEAKKTAAVRAATPERMVGTTAAERTMAAREEGR